MTFWAIIGELCGRFAAEYDVGDYTLTFTDVSSNQSDPIIRTYDIREFKLEKPKDDFDFDYQYAVAINGVLMIPDVDLIAARISQDLCT